MKWLAMVWGFMLNISLPYDFWSWRTHTRTVGIYGLSFMVGQIADWLLENRKDRK